MAFVEGDGFDCQSERRLSERDLAACCLGIVLIMTAAVGRPSLLRVASFPGLRSRILQEWIG